MKPSLADQLKAINFDFHEYGRLPIRETILILSKKPKGEYIQALWEKLLLIRKNLKIVDKYIHNNKNETINEWIYNNQNEGMSHIVLSKIGNRNNETGGVTAYFLDLQKFYDQEEEKYNKIESEIKIPEDDQRCIYKFREERREKSKERAKIRQLKTKELKKEGKGFFMIAADEPVKKESVDNSSPIKKESIDNSSPIPLAAIGKAKKNIELWIAGTLITITAISTFVALNKK